MTEIKKVGITGRYSNEFAIETARKAVNLLKEKNVGIIADESFPVVDYKETLEKIGEMNDLDLILSFGGDGTFLKTARLVKGDTPIAGVNCGRLGFLLELKGDEIEKEISNILEGKFHLQKRSRIGAKVDGKEITPALNEFAIVPKLSGRLIRYDLHIDDWFSRKEGSDGIIIATPTGSTGHSLSAGGPIIVAEAEVFVVTSINPVDWSNRPIVINDKSRVRIDNFSRGRLEIIGDGQERYDADSLIEITKGRPITVLRTKRALNKLVKVREF